MKIFFYRCLLCVVLTGFGACTLFDPTVDVDNPNLTLKAILSTPNPTKGWLNGLERQLTITYNSIIVPLEIASDNYQNTQSTFNVSFDELVIDFRDADVRNIQFNIADLRQSAIIGLEQVIPNDPLVTNDQRARMYFFKGWSLLLAGELFVALPQQPSGQAVSAQTNIDSAIVNFLKAEAIDSDNPSYKLALARAYYDKGDRTNAVAKALEVLDLDNTFARTVIFDGVSSPSLTSNIMQNALYDRGSFDDLQPLPRLDFLDPKYFTRSSLMESPVYFQKSEEAFLILVEDQLADDDLDGAKELMKSLLDLVDVRPEETFSDEVEGRTQNNPGSRPNIASVEVRASGTDPYRAGLVLTRGATPVTVPVISGTSVTEDMIDDLASVEEALEMLYLLRQEIFIAEGRRFSDLGLKLPVAEAEFLANPAITTSQTVAFIPDFLPDDMDEFTYDMVGGTCTINWNMNRILVENRSSDSVLPFE